MNITINELIKSESIGRVSKNIPVVSFFVAALYWWSWRPLDVGHVWRSDYISEESTGWPRPEFWLWEHILFNAFVLKYQQMDLKYLFQIQRPIASVFISGDIKISSRLLTVIVSSTFGCSTNPIRYTYRKTIDSRLFIVPLPALRQCLGTLPVRGSVRKYRVKVQSMPLPAAYVYSACYQHKFHALKSVARRSWTIHYPTNILPRLFGIFRNFRVY